MHANAVRPTRVSLTTTESRTRPPRPTHRANLTITEPSECERDGSQLPHQRHVVLGYRRDRPPHSRIGTRGLTLISTLPAFISPFSLPFILLPTPDAQCPSHQGAPSNFGTEGATCNIDDAFGRRRTTYNTSRGKQKRSRRVTRRTRGRLRQRRGHGRREAVRYVQPYHESLGRTCRNE